MTEWTEFWKLRTWLFANLNLNTSKTERSGKSKLQWDIQPRKTTTAPPRSCLVIKYSAGTRTIKAFSRSATSMPPSMSGTSSSGTLPNRRTRTRQESMAKDSSSRSWCCDASRRTTAWKPWHTNAISTSNPMWGENYLLTWPPQLPVGSWTTRRNSKSWETTSRLILWKPESTMMFAFRLVHKVPSRMLVDKITNRPRLPWRNLNRDLESQRTSMLHTSALQLRT